MSRLLEYIAFGIRWLAWQVRRPLRRLRRPPAWVLFLVERTYPEVPPPPRPRWQRFFGGRPSLSLGELRSQFRTIAADPRTTGVILNLRQLDLTQAQVQAFREPIAELRAAGKRVVAYASTYNTGTYQLACACDEVLLMRGGGVNAVGYARAYTFLADALDRVGLHAEVLQISPYKTAMDFLTRREMSDQAREMANWLADAAFEELLGDIAAGRSLDPVKARAIVDTAPLSEEEALEMGAVDAVLYEEEIAARLNGRMAYWRDARQRLPRPAPRRPGRHVALLRIEGVILDGRSSNPPVGPRLPVPLLFQSRAGDLTVAGQARRLADNDRVGAVLLWVDSGGGSSSASEAMTSALSALAGRKPLVAVMGSVAASGGYHVVTAAQRVFAQPGTITGSIGVLGGKLTTGQLFERALLHRERIVRGEHADMFGLDRPFSEEERGRMRRLIEHTYDQFVERVAQGRRLSPEAVKEVGGGRVWTGRQALDRALVDELGGVELALVHARNAAGLPDNAPLREHRGAASAALPTGSMGALIGYALETTALLNRWGAWLLSPVWAAEA